MHKTLSAQTSYLLFPLIFIVLFQLWGAILSTLHLSFTTLITTAAIITLAISIIIARHLTRTFTITPHQLAFTVGLSAVTSFLFILRLNWLIFDYYCPTGVLGLVAQIAGGKFPASFVSFPDIVMNYHQGFVFTAGVLSYITHITPAFATMITMVGSFFLLNIYVSLFFISIKSPYYYLPPLLFTFVTSINLYTITGIDFTWYNYVSIFEYSGSNSWPLAFMLLNVWLFFIYQYQHTVKNILIAAILILALATINATLFSTMVLTVPVLGGYYWYVTKRFPYSHFILCTSLLIVVFIIPRFLPSAFLVGSNYASPGFDIRILYEGLSRYALHIGRLVVLAGPLILFSTYTVYLLLKKPAFDWRVWFVGMFVVALGFPLMFGFPNVDVWDNLHKFALIMMYVSPILIIVFFYDTSFTPKQITIYLIICFIASITSLTDIAKHRLSTDFTHQVFPVARVADITKYLTGARKMIVPYNMDGWGACEADRYAGIADNSGNYIADSYYTNFLLSQSIEDKYVQDITWTNATDTTLAKLASLNNNSVMVIDRRYEAQFLNIYHQFTPPPNRHLKYFTNFLLYE